MLTEREINKNWNEIKGALRNLWRDLTNDEMEKGRENLFELTNTVQKKYGESKQEINRKLHQLLDSFDNDTDKGNDPDISSYHRSPL
jgi:hypothetical protein